MAIKKITPMAGESNIPDIEDSRMINLRKYGLLAAVLVIGSGYLFMKYTSADGTDEKPVVEQMAGTSVTPRVFNNKPVHVEPVAVVESVPLPDVEPKTIIKYRDRPAPAIPRVNKGRSGALVMAAVDDTSARATNPQAATQQTAGTGGTVSDGVVRGYAGKLSNIDRLVLQGVSIPCTLNGGINTQLAGNISCTVSRDIWSADNSRILVAKGSKANGQYAIETTSSAITRVGVIWGRIRTTDNYVALLASEATDPQGGAGIPANYVQHHVLAKFGAAFAVSLIEGVFQTVSTGNSSGDVVVNSATGSGSRLASQVLAATINLPTTRHVLPGSEIAIYLQRDIEFEAAL